MVFDKINKLFENSNNQEFKKLYENLYDFKLYCSCSFKDKDQLKNFGFRWSPDLKLWYIQPIEYKNIKSTHGFKCDYITNLDEVKYNELIKIKSLDFLDSNYVKNLIDTTNVKTKNIKNIIRNNYTNQNLF